ncbi:MAG: leucine-rich repeat domain-containing protein [Xenococcaceae cyanobacterium]
MKSKLSSIASELPLWIWLETDQGETELLGQTGPGTEEIELPEHRACWVGPVDGDVTAFFREVEGQQLPGIALRGLELSKSDLKRLQSQKHLRWLRLSDCPNLGNADLKYLTALEGLERLDLSGCQELSGGLSALKGLPLRSLSLSRCYNFKATGLKALAELKWLETLDLSGCGATDKTAKALGALTNLQWLDLSWDEAIIRKRGVMGIWRPVMTAQGVGSTGLGQLEKLPHLTTLGLRRHYLDGRMIKRLAKFSSLEHLELSYCSWDDESPELPFDRLKGLRKLSLRGVEEYVVGNLVNRARTMEGLRWLDLDEAAVRDRHLNGLEKATQLRELTVPFRVSPERVEQLRAALPDCLIHYEEPIGYVAFRLTEAMRQAKVYGEVHDLLADYRFTDEVVAYRVARKKVELTLMHDRCNRQRVTVEPLRFFPSAEEALQQPLELDV